MGYNPVWSVVATVESYRMVKTLFGVRLKELREAAGMTQGQLADLAGMNMFGIAKLEQGLRDPGWSTVLAIAAALKVTPNEFITVGDEAYPNPAPRGRPSRDSGTTTIIIGSQGTESGPEKKKAKEPESTPVKKSRGKGKKG